MLSRVPLLTAPVSLSLPLNSKRKKEPFTQSHSPANLIRDFFALVFRLNFLAFRLECNLFARLANYIYQLRVETPRERAEKAFLSSRPRSSL